MSEILERAFARPHALTQSRNYAVINVGEWPKYIWDCYPLAQNYYHEFNPYFVHLIPKESVFSGFSVFTVRDGAFAFADFMVKNVKEIPKWETHFIIPEKFAPLVPDNLRSRFFSYTTSQIKKADIRTAKTVTVFVLLCDQYFGTYEAVERKLAALKDMPKDAKLEVCLAMRKNPFSLGEEKENFHYIQIPEMIRKHSGGRDIRWMRIKEFMERSALKDNYVLDLMEGELITSDSYLHHSALQRGGMVNLVPDKKRDDSIFDLDLSFNQRLHIHGFPKVPSQFAELMFFAKSTKQELLTHPLFQDEVRKIMKTTV